MVLWEPEEREFLSGGLQGQQELVAGDSKVWMQGLTRTRAPKIAPVSPPAWPVGSLGLSRPFSRPIVLGSSDFLRVQKSEKAFKLLE